MPNSYEQPVAIPSRQLKSLHNLAEQLLDSLDASPATYLLQFSLYNGEIVFDRLWPFPAAPALITLKTQRPDLFTCHWQCLTKQSIKGVNISNPMPI
jgi:formate-dependent phosphoribosylglycinamide formyltransferase (GAR transformylase)